MTKRPAILTLIAHYVPGFKAGGPVRSILHLVEGLGDEFDFHVLCADRDLGDNSPYVDIERDRWVQVGLARVHYTSPTLLTPQNLVRLIRGTPHDALYLNSFFSPRFAIAPLVARRIGALPRRPLVIAPRGEFSPGALAMKPAKKRGYITLGKAAGLFKHLTWQASSAAEAEDIRAGLGRQADDIVVALNLPALLPSVPPPHVPRAPAQQLRVAFLSRISPKKNLDFALRVLAQVSAPVAFSIYGPEEDAAYKSECEKLAEGLPQHISVTWKGPVNPAEVPGVMAENDLFFLPTRGENYGHVIAEALGAGTPVLISDTTPWRGLAELGVGDDLPLAYPVGFAVAIDRAARSSEQETAERRARAFQYAKQRQKDGADVEANRRLFLSALGRQAS